MKIAGMEVTPLKGNHFGNMGENSANYLIKMTNGKVLYYGLDSLYCHYCCSVAYWIFCRYRNRFYIC